MIRPIMTSEFFLRRPSEPATAEDAPIAQDLADTLAAYQAVCAGMAANMIGERKRIIAVCKDDGAVLVMLNPEITRAEGTYEAEEGCLSLEGTRVAIRHKRVTVAYQDEQMRPHERTFVGGVAQAVQHEIDHCDGILI